MTDSIAVLDTLPPKCSLISEIDRDNDRVRFRAQMIAAGTILDSKWSGWFPLAETPIRLSWVAFDFGPHQ